MRAKEPRKGKTICLKPELWKWIDQQIEKGRFWIPSHAVEFALEQLRGSEGSGCRTHSGTP